MAADQESAVDRNITRYPVQRSEPRDVTAPDAAASIHKKKPAMEHLFHRRPVIPEQPGRHCTAPALSL